MLTPVLLLNIIDEISKMPCTEPNGPVNLRDYTHYTTGIDCTSEEIRTLVNDLELLGVLVKIELAEDPKLFYIKVRPTIKKKLNLTGNI